MPRTWMALLGGALLAGCSLDGLIFDIGGSGGAGSTSAVSSGSKSSATSTSVSSSASSSGSGGAMPTCMTAATSSSSGGAQEDCTDGIDNDGDGKIDCEDPDCMTAGYTCTDVPSGWLGPVALFEGDPLQNPCCPGDYPTLKLEGGSGVIAGPYGCAVCACAPPSVTCTPSPLVSHAVAGCGDMGVPYPQDNMCDPASGSFFAAKPPSVSVGNCAPQGGGAVVKPPPAWMTADRICAGAGKAKGCSGTQVCARPADGVFGSAVCVYSPMAQASCPAAFPKKHSFFTKFADSRGCGACGCGAPSATCTVTTSVYSMTMCNVNKKIADVPNDGTCIAAPSGMSFKANITPTASCPPTGGGPTGMVTGDTTTETTVCCTP